jgi:hypothetical protein
VHGILSLLEYGDRLSEQFYLNSNVVGVVCAMSMVTNVYYILKDKRIRWWNLFLLPGVIILSATGSRQALAIMAGGLVLLMFLTIRVRQLSLSRKMLQTIFLQRLLRTRIIKSQAFPDRTKRLFATT